MEITIVGAIERFHQKHRNQRIALVSHGDVTKAAIAFYLSIPLDFIQRFDIGPASVTVLALEDHGPVVWSLNYHPWKS